MKLYLIRHGQTLENLSGIIQSNLGGILSPEGIKQVEKLSLKLRKYLLDFIFTSDLKRAVDTAKTIKRFQNCPLIELLELREADFGKYVGVKKTKVNWKEIYREVESQEQLQQRMRNFYDGYIRKYENTEKKIAVVSHAGSLKALTSVLLGEHSTEIWDLPTPKNTSLSYFNIEQNNIRMIYYNNTDHLIE